MCFRVDGTSVKVFRWTDQVLGPRTMPDIKSPLAGLTEVTPDQSFSINSAEKTVTIGDIALTSGLIFRISE